MKARDMMRQAHMTGEVKSSVNKEQPQQEVKSQIIEPEVQIMEVKVEDEKVEDIPTGILQVKRKDVSIDEYGVKPDITNFQLYNYELSEFLTSFSKRNKKNGGNPITKSQLMETILGFAMYDLNLRPDGYENTEELLKDLNDKRNK